jgi:polysaccharide export outer membrane protein
LLFAAFGLGLGLAGCSTKFWDPAQIGRFRVTPAVNVILDSLGAAEEAPVAWESGEEPRPSDILPAKTDYVLSPGDLVRVSIFELLQEGLALISDYVISETGKLSLPEVGVIQAAGLTETQLEEEIKQILSPNILREPSVTVMLMNSQQRTFSILGNGVARPSRYVIPRNDFRLTDALATAGAQMQFNGAAARRRNGKANSGTGAHQAGTFATAGAVARFPTAAAGPGG